MPKMFKFVFVAAVLAVVLGINAAAAAANGPMMISQVIYIPAGTNSGGEAVELYNPAAVSTNISGWVLATETSPTDATIPDNTVVCGGCYYLIADSGWAAAKDNASWPNADFEEAITLANSDAGVALKDASGMVVDAVGWGNPANIGTGLYEGIPHGGSSTGNSLTRRMSSGSYTDTNNNSDDFQDAAPSFRNSSLASPASASSAEISITIVVSSSAPAISSLRILEDDDSYLPGIQLSPAPKTGRIVTVEAVVSDANGVSDISSLTLVFSTASISMAKKSDINSTAAVYSAALGLPSSFPAGNHTIVATATDSGGFSSAQSVGFEYLTLIAFEADVSSITLFSAPGADETAPSDAANVTLQNSGNVPLDFEIWASNFTSENSRIMPSMLQYAFLGSYSDASSSGNLTNSRARKDVNLDASASATLRIRMSLPRSTVPGNYSGIISLVAVDSG